MSDPYLILATIVEKMPKNSTLCDRGLLFYFLIMKHRILATSAAIVTFVYFLVCSIITNLFPEISFRMYAMAFHGIRLTNLQATVLTVPEMFLGAAFYAVMVWIFVCAAGWLYNKLTKK